MINVPYIPAFQPLNYNALDAALRAAVGAHYVQFDVMADQSLVLRFTDNATQGDQDTAVATCNAHDPVFLVLDKYQIAADDVEIATVTVTAPKPGAGAVVLVIGSGVSTTVTVTLTNGAGAITIHSGIAGTIPIRLQTQANRNIDTLNLAAVAPTGIPDGLATVAGQDVSFRGTIFPDPFQNESALNINAKVIGNTKLGTTQAGVRVFATEHIIASIVAASGATVGPTFSVGTNSPNYDNILPATTLPLLAVNLASVFMPQGAAVVQPGTDIFCRVSVAAVATGNYRIAVHDVGFYV